ncbi:MAG: hypothetical protein NTX25_20490 [Proteobacteria bacterium]|nr:hypothetical protein [Pseudomonadota bacterium]
MVMQLDRISILISSLYVLACTTASDSGRAIPAQPGQSGPQSHDEAERIVGTWALPINQSSAQQEHSSDPNKILVPVGDYAEADFDRYGFWDGSGDFEHVYGGDSFGSFLYRFKGPSREARGLEVSVRLSAESKGLGKITETSDVELFLNGQSLGKKNVRSDDNKGQVYTWRLLGATQVKRLKIKAEASNELRFIVAESAKHRNGLCIYGRTLASSSLAGGQPIILKFLDSPAP